MEPPEQPAPAAERLYDVVLVYSEVCVSVSAGSEDEAVGRACELFEHDTTQEGEPFIADAYTVDVDLDVHPYQPIPKRAGWGAPSWVPDFVCGYPGCFVQEDRTSLRGPDHEIHAVPPVV